MEVQLRRGQTYRREEGEGEGGEGGRRRKRGEGERGGREEGEKRGRRGKGRKCEYNEHPPIKQSINQSTKPFDRKSF